MTSYKGNTIYFGDLHTHTGFSDGKLTPKEAFEHAKHKGNLDFMAVSDHAGSITPEKFKATLQAKYECTILFYQRKFCFYTLFAHRLSPFLPHKSCL